MNLSAAADALQRHRRTLTLAGVALLLVAAWTAAAAHGAPVSERHVESSTAWMEASTFTYAVPVTRNSTLYPLGTQLPMGEPTYFRTVSDSVHVNYTWMPTSSDPEARGLAAGTLTLRVFAQAPDGRTYWSIERVLAETAAPDATQGLSMYGRIDLDELVHEVEVLEHEMPVVEGSINWTVKADVAYAFEAAGQREQGRTERLLVIVAGDPRFNLPPPEDITWTKAHEQERVTHTTRAAGIPGIVTSWRPFAFAGGGIALIVLASAATRLSLGEAFDREHRRFRDWVSTAGRIPDHACDAATTVDVRSLEDLVHVAADARTRVLLDERSRVFYAFLPGVTYRYARHAY